MNTTVTLPYTRFIRRANSGVITNTQWLGAMDSTFEALKTAPWIETAEQKARHTVNDPTSLDFSGAEYDAFRQSGAAIAETGEQVCFTGMAVYRIAVPSTAQATHITGISFRATSDKFCVGGLKIAAILSNSATPPTDWEILRHGGTASDVTGKFATLGAVDEQNNETAGVLSDTNTLIAKAQNHAGTFTLDLSANAASYTHIYLAVSMFQAAGTRREYWVEGSGAIDGTSIAVTFAAAIEEPAASADIAYPAAAALPIAANFAAAPATIINPYLRLVYAARMLNGGRLADSATPTPTPETDPAITLSPSVRHVSGGVEARGIMVEIHAPRTLTAGRTMWLRSITAMQGASPARISVINSAAQPDADDPATWDGSAQNCIGSVVASGVAAGQYIAIPITRDTTASRIWLVAAIADVRESDAAAPLVGWETMQGIDLTNSLISRNRYLPSAAPSSSGWAAFAPSGTGVIIFPALLPGGANPGDEDLYAISNSGSAAPGATSAGTWRQLSDDAYAAPMSVVRARDNCFVGLSATSGAICVSGDDSWLDSNIDRAALPTQNTDILSVLDGFLVVRAGAVNAFGEATTTAFGDTVSHWAGVSKIRGCFGTAFAVAIKTSGGVYAAGFSVSAQSQLEALTNVVDVRISPSRLIAKFSDGSASAWEITGTNIGSTALVTWSACYSIAATPGAVWAINDTGVVFSGLPFATAIYNASSIPAGATPTVIVGSAYLRLAVAYMEV